MATKPRGEGAKGISGRAIKKITFFAASLIVEFKHLCRNDIIAVRVLCNQLGTFFAEMSSWKALTRHIGMKAAN